MTYLMTSDVEPTPDCGKRPTTVRIAGPDELAAAAWEQRSRAETSSVTHTLRQTFTRETGGNKIW